MASSPGDFLIRRTRLAVHSANHGRATAPIVAAEMGALLGWSGARIEAEVGAYDREVSRILGALPGLAR
jgi:glycerol-3-phosphate dehydrogenase